MKITKFVHSCLLAETPDRVALIDPGEWSWQSGTFNIDAVERIDRIVISHAHPDHFSPDFVNAVLAKFPEAHVVANEAVTDAMKKAGIDATFRGDETQCTKPFTSPHEALPVPGVEPPKQTGFHFQDELTHPGDSHSFNETKRILALPVIAPWGSTVDAVNLALKLKPEHVIPIHDWHYSPEGKQWLYGILDSVFSAQNIVFHSLKDGEPVEI